MRAKRTLTVVGCHAGGEIGNVVVGGVLPPPGATVFEQMQALARDDCVAGYIIMEPTEYAAMSGSNTICVATVLLETGMVEMQEPETTLRLEAPAGIVEVTARCRGSPGRSLRGLPWSSLRRCARRRLSR